MSNENEDETPTQFALRHKSEIIKKLQDQNYWNQVSGCWSSFESVLKNNRERAEEVIHSELNRMWRREHREDYEPEEVQAMKYFAKKYTRKI